MEVQINNYGITKNSQFKRRVLFILQYKDKNKGCLLI